MNTALDKKLLFFDVDGTLVNHHAVIPASAKKALKSAQENGHKLIICTGRSMSQLHTELADISFDGYICAAGAYVQYQKKEISCNKIPTNLLTNIIHLFKENNMVYALQCGDHIVTEKGIYEPLVNIMKKKLGINQKQFDSVFYGLQFEEEPQKLIDVEKALFYDTDLTIDTVKRELGKEFDVVSMSLVQDSRVSGEITRAGINKAYGMQKLLDYLGLERKDTIAFGDSENDMEMLKFAGIGIAMGNATDNVKANADLVTKDINDEGIFYALKLLRII